MTNPVVSLAHKFLSLPLAYDLFQRAVGSAKYIENLTVKTLAKESNFVLDLGCGTGRAISKLHDQSSYLGMDLSSDYILKAKKVETAANVTLITDSVSGNSWLKHVNTEIPVTGIARGLYHHLPDYDLNKMLENLSKRVIVGSTINSMDPVVMKDSSTLASWVARNDRGKFLRSPNEMQKVMLQHGFSLEFAIEKRVIRLPVDVMVAQAVKI